MVFFTHTSDTICQGHGQYILLDYIQLRAQERHIYLASKLQARVHCSSSLSRLSSLARASGGAAASRLAWLPASALTESIETYPGVLKEMS